MQKVMAWQLADDFTAYGADAGRWIVVTADGEDEVSDDVFDSQEAAEAWARAAGYPIADDPEPPRLALHRAALAELRADKSRT